ncbi:unnamed protein product [Effrenium voratum]|uniref:Alpha-amylase n=1 Tax=Effrenium voratum TaxID=2562239 RepID=A0AA36J1Z5_9DINO|nr:unnamed protein product [Effrenium voratum]CAJ1412547.1 unnamed protein product [Effrenium voratum]
MVLLRLEVSSASRAAKAGQTPGAACCVVGAAGNLGGWDPKCAPELAPSGPLCWQGDVDAAGEEFKICIYNSSTHDYTWEEQGPLHRLPMSGSLRATFEDAGSDVADAAKPAAAAKPEAARSWRVVGGGDKGGIVVRSGVGLSSPEAAERLATGAVLQELQRVEERLQFRKVSGEGPEEGWVSLRLKGKDLVVPADAASASAATESPTGCVLRVRVPQSSARAAEVGRKEGAVCTLVGEGPALGGWDPKRAPKLRRRSEEEGATIWEGSLDGLEVSAGQQFKVCILHEPSSSYVWEEAGPMHHWPSASETQEFEAGVSHGGGGGGGLLPWPPSATAPAPAPATAVRLEAGIDRWIPWGGSACGSLKAPRSIFHAFHWAYALVTERLADIAALGFDGVQLSPAQKSKSGHEWWARYQPQDYLKIEGLGSFEELKGLCAKAKELRLLVLGDVVFNHMIVVASGHEWKAAQKSPERLKELQRRLVSHTAMELEDFQWPWFDMSGEHWDNENRFEGWGNGEWSELRYCKKVVDVQQKHLQLLLDAGVRGIRFDAVKHIRPKHVEEHLQHLQPHEVFSYGEVLSVDAAMHQEYMEPLKLPSTDFPLAVFLYRALSEGVKAADEGVLGACSKVGLAAAPPKAAAKPAESAALSADSVRFARNHDTVMNPGLYYGLNHSAGGRSALVWLWLLSVHDGCVLVFAEDLQKAGPLLCRGLRFRRDMASASSSEVCLRFSDEKTAPKLLLVILRNPSGELLGLAAVNLSKSALEVPCLPVRGELSDESGRRLRLEDQCLKDETGQVTTIVIPGADAAFLRL